MILPVGRYGGFKDSERQHIAQIQIGHVLALRDQCFVHLLLILCPGVEPGQPCLHLLKLLVLLADFTVPLAHLCRNTALLHGARFRAFVNHGNALLALPGIASMIDKALHKPCFPQRFIDGVSSGRAPDFSVSAVIPVHGVFLVRFPAPLLFGGDAVAVRVEIVHQPALGCPAPVLLQGAHGQHDVNVGIAVALVVKGHVGAHALIYKGFLHKLADECDVLLVRQLGGKRQLHRAGQLGIALCFAPFHAVPQHVAVGVFRRRLFGQHDLGVYHMTLAGVIVGRAVPRVFLPRCADVRRRSHSGTSLVPRDDLDRAVKEIQVFLLRIGSRRSRFVSWGMGLPHRGQSPQQSRRAHDIRAA